MPKRRFDWGKPYLLTDLKEGVFRNELGVCVYKHDADKEHPNMCAVCGETLGAKDYYTFCLKIPGGGTRDMMIGTGCIRDRIRATEADVETGYSPKETLDIATTEFPQSGRWYGTFLHHCIAKPYVRNKANAEKWGDTILRLPGVRYIMDVIDELRDDGWNLDAEMVLGCGNVDLLATHPEKGTLVFDWKSDLSFDNHDAYIKQINRYMAELYTAGMPNLSGYILWVRDRKKEYVPFEDIPEIVGEIKTRQYVPSQRIKCKLNIDMDGGSGIRMKTITEYSHHRIYGDEAFFYIPPCDPIKQGFEFSHFEASPYKKGECPQAFNWSDLQDGLRLSFICAKNNHSFYLKAYWKRERPFPCTLNVTQVRARPRIFTITRQSVSEGDVDYAEFDITELKSWLQGETLLHAALLDRESFTDTKTEWGQEDLIDGMKIRIPCINERTVFNMTIETEAKSESISIPNSVIRTEAKPISKPKKKTNTTPVLKQEHKDTEPKIIPGSWEAFYKSLKDNPLPPPVVKNEPKELPNDVVLPELDSFLPTKVQKRDLAQMTFTPGHIYKSGRGYYRIYKRKIPQKENTYGMVDVAEVDINGKKISNLARRHVYKTKGGKEYIYGISNINWKIYTQNVLIGIPPEGMDKYGER